MIWITALFPYHRVVRCIAFSTNLFRNRIGNIRINFVHRLGAQDVVRRAHSQAKVLTQRSLQP